MTRLRLGMMGISIRQEPRAKEGSQVATVRVDAEIWNAYKMVDRVCW